MSMTDREFILALRSVAAEEFTDTIKECEHNPHEFSSDFTQRMDTLLRKERRLSWRIMNAITSNVAAALLIIALLLTNVLVSSPGNAFSTDFKGVLEGEYAPAQIHDTVHAFIVKQNESLFYKENRSASLKNVIYVNDEGGDSMLGCPYVDDEYGECICNCHIESYLFVEYLEYTGSQNITH